MDSVRAPSDGTVLRILTALLAAGFVTGTVLFLGIALNAFGTPPNVPAPADLPTRLLDTMPYDQQIWPFDLTSNLLYTLGFVALALIGALLPSLSGRGGASVRAFAGALVLAGILGAGAELVYVGARSQIVNIGYCDCGFKSEEAISQFWALNLVQGAQSWLVDASAILLAIGVAGVAVELGAQLVSTAWVWWSLATAVVVLVAAILSTLNVGAEFANALQGVAAGILIPVWAAWLGWTAGARRAAEALDARAQPTTGGAARVG